MEQQIRTIRVAPSDVSPHQSSCMLYVLHTPSLYVHFIKENFLLCSGPGLDFFPSQTVDHFHFVYLQNGRFFLLLCSGGRVAIFKLIFQFLFLHTISLYIFSCFFFCKYIFVLTMAQSHFASVATRLRLLLFLLLLLVLLL